MAQKGLGCLSGFPRWKLASGRLGGVPKRVSRRSFTRWLFRRKCLTRGSELKILEEVLGKLLSERTWSPESFGPQSLMRGTTEPPSALC